jgi:hypothetical protein
MLRRTHGYGNLNALAMSADSSSDSAIKARYDALPKAKLEDAANKRCCITLNDFNELKHPVALVKRNRIGEAERDQNGKEVTYPQAYEFSNLEELLMRNPQNPFTREHVDINNDLRRVEQ